VTTVLVTGASSGFGQACVRKFAENGHKVILAARRQDRIEALADSLGDAAHGITLDVRDRTAVFKAIEQLPESFSDVGILINNAGLALGMGGAQEADVDEWDTMVDTNVKGVMYMCRAVLPGMLERGGGHVVNIGSVAASWPYAGGNTYGSTKAFVQQFSRNMRVDLLGKNVRVTNVEPGMSETEFSVVRFSGDEDKARQFYAGMKPLDAEDVAEIVYWTTALPAHININQLEVMPANQSWQGFAVHRDS